MTHLLVLLIIPTKHYQNMSKGVKVMERTRMRLQYFCFRGDNYITNKVRAVSLHGTSLLVILFTLPNIIKLSQTVWELWPAQDFGFRGDNYITKIVGVVSLARDAPSGPLLHSYQILSKYVQGYRSYGAQKDASTDAMLIAISPEPIRRGINRNSLITRRWMYVP